MSDKSEREIRSWSRVGELTFAKRRLRTFSWVAPDYTCKEFKIREEMNEEEAEGRGEF